VRPRERLFLVFVYTVLLFVVIAIGTLAIGGCVAPADQLSALAVGSGMNFTLHGYFNPDGTFRVCSGQGHWVAKALPSSVGQEARSAK